MIAGHVTIRMARDGSPLIEGTGLALENAETDVAVLLAMMASLGVKAPFPPEKHPYLDALYARLQASANRLAIDVAAFDEERAKVIAGALQEGAFDAGGGDR